MNFGGTEYQDPDAILAREPHELTRKYMLQHVYKGYVSIRTVLGGQKCQKMPLHKVKAELENPDNMVKIMNALPHYDEKSIRKMIEIAEKYIPMVK